jgi:hypothetical protein
MVQKRQFLIATKMKSSSLYSDREKVGKKPKIRERRKPNSDRGIRSTPTQGNAKAGFFFLGSWSNCRGLNGLLEGKP